MMTKKTHLLFAIAIVLSAAAVAHAGRGSSSAAIRDAIATGNADVIASELERAEYLPCSDCVAPVLALLDSDNYRIRQAAAWWVTRRPFLKAAVTSSSIMRLSPGADPTAARNAADVLGTFRHPVVLPVLDTAIGAGFPDATKAAVVRAVGTIGSPTGLSIVQKGLGAAGPMTRAAAVQAYFDLRGTRDGADLVAVLGDGDAGVRRIATATIGNYNVAAARDKLISLVASDPDPLVRKNAAWALGRLGDGAARAALTAAANGDSVSYVRSVASAALKMLR